MEKSVSAAAANRKLSKLLQGVRNGESYVVTSNGKPVARMSQMGKTAAQHPARRPHS